MKHATIKTTEAYFFQSDEVRIRIDILLLEKKTETEFIPKQQLCIDFKKDYVYKSEELVNKLRILADTIDNASR